MHNITMNRLWRVLQVVFMVVLVGACSLSSTVRCDIPIGSTINVLPLSLDAATVAKLSNSPNQEAWWPLTDEDWHDSAIDRFFSVGPLTTAQMDKLAAQSRKKDAWKLSGINAVSTRAEDLIQRLQHAATTEYKMNKSIPGTGDIEVSMWSLMFRCKSSNCTDGYMVPLAVVPTVDASNQTVFAYATLWHNPTDMMLINAIPASVNNQPERLPVAPLYSSVTPVCNIQHLPACRPAGAHVFRALLDSAYGLATEVSCVGFADEDESFKIVVTGSPFDQSEVRPVPLWQCSQAPLMTMRSNIITMCSDGRCIPLEDLNSIPALPDRLSYIKLKLSALENCPVVLSSGAIDNTTVDCSGHNISVLAQNSTSLNSLSAESNWVSTHGNDTLDFQYAPQYNAANVCYVLFDTDSPSTNVTPPVEIMIQALDYLTRYIAAHNAAFTTEKGPATDPYTFYALIVSTALSVVTIAVPFTDFMLGAICRIHPFYLSSRNKAMKIIMQVWCNVVLGLAFFLPVLSLAKNELDRQQAFSTWALASEDLVYDQITSTAPVRVLYFFTATSHYNSHFLAIILLVICLTCIPVAVSTAKRCLQVFTRYGLICKDSKSQMPSSSPSAFMKAMEAIEMGEAEYLDLLSRVEAGDLELYVADHRTSRSSKF